MGYELNKLMRQFGVSTPGVANYSGAVAPVAPLEPMKESEVPATGMRAARNLLADAEYDNAMERYRTDLASYETNKEPQTAAATADRAAYDAYRNAYMDRVMNTPQYMDAQYQAAPSAAVNWATSPVKDAAGGRGIGMDRFQQNIRDYVANNAASTPFQLRAEMDKYGISGYDAAQARGGSMWGTPLAMPTYQNYTPFAVAAPAVAAPAVAAPAVAAPSVYDYESGYGAAEGGAVRDLAKKYAAGGAVHKFRLGGAEGEPEDPMEAFLRERNLIEGEQPPMAPAVVAEPAALRAMPPPVTASPAAQPVVPPPSATTPVSPAANDLMGMLGKYLGQESVYGPELKAARARADTESAAFQKLIADATKGDGTAPDKSEMYFRLAAAFGAPTKTGSFTENLGMVGKELGEYAKDRRTSARADKQLRLQLGLEAQKLRAQTAREDLTTLRTLTGEEMKDKRAVLQEYLKSGRPQSEAGKVAQDSGLQPGTPEYNQFVKKYVERKLESGDLYKQAMVNIAAGNLAVRQSTETRAAASAGKLTPAEMNLKAEAETALGSLDDAMGSLKRAYSLNPNTFEGTFASIAQQKLLEQTNPKDPRVLATREQRNLLSKGAISNLRAAFGGNPTEGERNALLDLEGLDAKSKEERARIMKNTYALLRQRRAREQKRLDDVAAGLYREATPASGPGDIE